MPRLFVVAALAALFGGSALEAMAQPFHLSPPRFRNRHIVAVPLPRPRPPEAGPRLQPTPEAANPESSAAETAPTEPPPPSACFLALTDGLALAVSMPPISGPKGCEAPDVVRLDAIILRDNRRVAVTPPAVLRCEMATAIVNWARDDLATLAAPLAGIDNFDSFECRGRNRVQGAKTSEHGRANALDVRALRLANGKLIELTDTEVPIELREQLRASACARFTTVLGPGSDGFHENHVHIDLAERTNGYRLCQWDVRETQIPLPRERPSEAPPRTTL